MPRTEAPRVLVIDDDEALADSLSRLLSRRGYTADTAGSAAEAERRIGARRYEVALVDLQLPDLDGFALIRKVRTLQSDLECIAMTGYGSPVAAARAAGATDFFEKPVTDHERLFHVLGRAIELQALRRTVETLAASAGSDSFLGVSAHARATRDLIDRFAGVGAPVLITGESGVGKEVVAEAVHRASGRPGDLVRINCAALPEALVEAELFGVEAGTFTGQRGRRPGLLETADRGTLFLDEIGELPVDLQPKLLRVLQSHAFRPLGSQVERPLTARIIAATNRDLERSVARAAFREDLFFRLCVLRLHVLPLRERREDIPVLATCFLGRHTATHGRPGLRLSAAAARALDAHPWPGNARELSSTLLRATLLAVGPEITEEDLGLSATGTTPPPPGPAAWDDLYARPLTEAKATAAERFTRSYLQALLARNDGNVSRAAREAGVLRPNLRREMKRFGVVVED